MDDNVIISSTQQTVGVSAANVSLLKLGTLGQTILGVVVTSVVIAATVATVILIGTGVGYQPPIANPDFVSLYKPDSLSIFPLANDKDPKGAALRITKVTQPTYGSVTINLDQVSLTYRGNGIYAGQDMFYYTVSNDKLSSKTYVNVTVMNHAPNCVDFEFSVSRNSIDNAYKLFTISQVEKTISDVDNDELFLFKIDQPSVSGSARFDNTTLYYTPAHQFSLSESLVYYVTDRNNSCNGTVTFQMRNDPPVAQVDHYRVRKNVFHELDVLANDYDPNGDAITITYYGFSRGNALLNDNSTRIFYWPPATTDPYFDSIEYQISDFEPLNSTSFATIEVYNTPPVAQNITVNVIKNTVDNKVYLQFSDIDDLDIVTASITQDPSYGSIKLVETQETRQALYSGGPADDSWFQLPLNVYAVLYTPSHGSDIDDSIQYTVTDSYDDATGFINFMLLNTAPIANNDYTNCSRNKYIDVNVIANDVDPDGDDMEVVLSGSITTTKGGSVSMVSSKVLRYTAPSTLVGTDSFTYTMRDIVMTPSKSKIATATVYINVYNEAPIAFDDTATVVKKNTVTINVLSNDIEPNGDPMTISSVSGPDSGSSVIFISSDKKTVQFKADTTVGQVHFTYVVSDDLGMTGTAIVTVTITNTPPVAVNDAFSTFWNRSVSLAPLNNDYDPDGDTIQISTYTQPSSGTLSLSGSKFLYVPNNGFVGTDSFSYRVTDSFDLSNTATITISVINTAPIANADTATLHWRISTGVTIDVVANDTDAQSDPLYVKSVSSPKNGNSSIVTLSDGRLGVRYVPTQPFVGTETFKYTVSDWSMTTDGGVTVTVTNTLPVANNDAFSLHWRTGSLTIQVLTNDVDADSDPVKIVSSALVVTPVGMGTASIVDVTAGTIIFSVPSPPVLGTCSFPYSITDGAQQSAIPATVSMTVTNANKPSAVPLSRTIHWRTLQTAGYTEFSPYNSVQDLDGDSMILTYTSPTNGLVVLNTVSNSPSTLRFSSTATWKKGAASFIYTLSDGASSNTSSISVTVYNNAPTAASITFALDPQYINSGIDIDVISQATDKDSEDTPFLYIKSIQASGTVNGTASVLNGKIHYQPKLNSVGTDIFTYTINDGLDDATNTIAITAKYTSVQPSQKFYTFHWRDIQSGVSLNLTDGITGVNPLSLTSVSSSPAYTGTVVIQSNKQNVTYTPVAKTIGVVNFAVSYTDTITTQTITVAITITNTAPTAPNKVVSTHWSTLLTASYGGFDVLSSSSDEDSDPITLTSAALVSGSGSVSLSSSKVVYLLGPAINGLYYVGSGDVQFSYTITDLVQSFTALTAVNVTNDAPVPISQTYSVHWSSYKNGLLLDVASGATDANSDTVSLYSLGSVSPSNAASSLVISGGKAYLTGTPPATLVGHSFSFAYTVSDGASIAQETATVTITNEPPIAKTITDSVHWRQKNVLYVVSQTPTDSDTITILSVTSNQGSTTGRISFSGSTLAYNPPSSFTGVEVVTFTISDGIQTTVGQATITVFNTPPVAKSYSSSSHWSASTSYTFTAQADATDVDPLDANYLSIQSTLVGLSSTLYTVSNGVITLTPSNAIKATGSLTVTYTVTDGLVASQGTISITFTNTPPVAPNVNISISRIYGQSRYTLTGPTSLLAIGTVDSDSDLLTLSIISGGQTTGTGNDVVVSIAEYFASSIQVQYVYNDGLVNSAVATATIAFTNSAPVCQPASLSVPKGQSKSVTVVCTDANNDPITITTGTLPSGLTQSGTTFTFAAPNGVKVTYTVPFTGIDGVGATGSNNLSITVTGQPPTANDTIWNVFARRDSRTHTLNYPTASGASDPDGDTVTFSIVSHTCTGADSMTINSANGIITFVRQYTYSNATCQIKVMTSDPDNLSITNTVTVVITTSGLNAVGQSITVTSQDGAFFTMTEPSIMSSDSDPLGGTLAFVGFYVSAADGCSASPPPANGFCGNVSPTSPSAGTWKLSQSSSQCQTQRFRYQIQSIQDPSQVGYAILNVRFQGCVCSLPLDIVFVIDGSGSIGTSNFALMRSFIQQIVAPLDIGTGATQSQVGIVLFDNNIYNILPLTSSKTTITNAMANMPYPAGATNIRSGVLSAERVLTGTNSRGATVPKMIITIFDGEPNTPCSCSQCSSAAYLSPSLCVSTRYPARDCNHCTSSGPLKCNPCGDVLSEARRINAKKPGNVDGYWRIMSIGVGPYLSNPTAKALIRDLSYNQDLSLSVDWTQLSTVVSTIQSQSCDLVDTSVSSDSYTEGTDIFAYCGQIIGISTGTYQWYVTDSTTAMTYTSNTFNSSDSRATLFQVVCSNFGTKVNSQSSIASSFALWSLQTEKYVVRSSTKFYANGASPQYFSFRPAVSALVSLPVPTHVPTYLQTSDGYYVYSSPLTASTSYATTFMLYSVSYNNIACTTGLRSASTFPVPITDATKSGAV